VPDVSRLARAGRGAIGVVARRSLVPSVRFLVLTPGRAGSTLLMSLLGSAPGVRTDEEVLRTAGSGDPAALLRRRARRAALGGVEAWGTSVHPEHLLSLVAGDPVLWAGRLHDDGYELVTLVRRNPLEHVLSAAIAWERGTWHDVGESVPSTEPVTLDPVPVLREAGLVVEAAALVQAMAADRSHLALVYEDDLREPDVQQVTVDRVFGFLGLPSVPVSSPFRRRSVGLLEQVANADEIVATVRATRFAPYLDELT
jgi:hypothetical protein